LSPRVAVNAVRPSGDQRGPFSPSAPLVSWTGCPPSTGARQMCEIRRPLFQSASLRV
jgi:hypothetical protein